MWGKKTVSLIVPSYFGVMEEVLDDFDSTGYIDEIIVVGDRHYFELFQKNMSTRARFLVQKREGLFNAVDEGIRATKADLIIVTEGNGSYKGKDILKLLSYSDDFDVVLGSRTHLPLIHKGSGMTFIRRLFNDIIGKSISILFGTSPLTDVGCNMRLTTMEAWRKVRKSCVDGGDLFVSKWLLAIARHKVKFIEIPVHFNPPKKPYIISSNFIYAIKTIKILFNMFKLWIKAA